MYRKQLLMSLCDFVVHIEFMTYFVKFQVDINNLEEYISLVVDATVKTGIQRQMEAFRAGFNQVKHLLLSFWVSK